MDALARSLAGSGLPHPLLVDAARAAIAAGDPTTAEVHVERARAALLQPVVNATGVLLHTNLGRAPLVKSRLALCARNTHVIHASGWRPGQSAAWPLPWLVKLPTWTS